MYRAPQAHAADLTELDDPAQAAHDGQQEHSEHHGLANALDTAGEICVSVLTSFVGPHKPEHWEQVLTQYERTHPHPDAAA